MICNGGKYLNVSSTNEERTKCLSEDFVEILNGIDRWFEFYKMERKEVGPRTAKLTLLLIKVMKYGIVQCSFYKYLEEIVYIYKTFIVNN